MSFYFDLIDEYLPRGNVLATAQLSPVYYSAVPISSCIERHYLMNPQSFPFLLLLHYTSQTDEGEDSATHIAKLLILSE